MSRDDLAAVGSPFQLDAVVCGGFEPVAAGGSIRWTPVAACTRFQDDGDVQAFPALPAPVAHAAIASLPDGGLLVTGGIDEELEEVVTTGTFASADALDVAFAYDPALGEWSEVGPMRTRW